MLANWNVPKPTIEIISLAAAAVAKTMEVPDVAVNSEFANFIPLTYRSMNPAS